MEEIKVIYAYMTESGETEEANITDIITEFTIKTTIEAQPGVLSITAILDDFEFILGSLLSIRAGDNPIFDGFIFSVTTSKSKVVNIQAYDVLRYLKNKDTYVFGKDKTAADIFKTVCKRLELEAGEIDETTWKQPPNVYENAGGFDVIREAIENTLTAEKKYFVLIPDRKKINFKNIENLRTDIIIDEENGEIDFTHNANIDQQTYNQIKIISEDAKTWKVQRDEDHIRQWGLLQYSQKFGEPVKEEQLPELAEKIAELYNKPQQTLQLTCFGNWEIRAGSGVHVKFSGFKNFDNAQGYYVRECTHTVSNGKHEMVLDLCANNIL